MNWKEIRISENGRHFVLNGEDPFDQEYYEVLKFHEPGFAAVKDESGAYHIKSDGASLYHRRYDRTFGYYFGKAAVQNQNIWFHIDEFGNRFYQDDYSWVGNFQEKLCVVRNLNNKYFHINLDGNQIYSNKYNYVGDFKDGIACVKLVGGHYTHINSDGHFIHSKYFLNLGIFHKGFAIAKDDSGWHHIDLQGDALYTDRFLDLEPFYNGYALATNFDNTKSIINEKGQTIVHL